MTDFAPPIARGVWTAELPDRHRLTAEAKLYSYMSQPPYFSVTGQLINKRYHGDRAIEASGMCHDLIAEYIPELKPVIAVHLADENGVPMHAVDQAVYFAGMSTWNGGPNGRPMSPRDEYGRIKIETGIPDGLEWAPELLIEHLRVAPQSARALRDRAWRANDHQAEWEAICAELAPIWKAHADTALAVLQGRTG